MRDVVLCAATRTAIGKGRPGGALHGWHPVDLLSAVLEEAAHRAGLDPARVDDVVGGCVSQAGEQAGNITRHAVLAAGFPEQVPATTVDRQCGSSLQAVAFVAQAIAAGSYDVAIACGVESMSRVPLGTSAGRTDPWGPALRDRYGGALVPPVVAAELLAARHDISRERMDAWGLRSHSRASAAGEAFTRELVSGRGLPDRDECPVEGLDPERLASSGPVLGADDPALPRFPEIDRRVSAFASPRLADAAAAVVLAGADTAEALGLPARARVVATAVAAADPIEQLTAIVPATERALERAGLTLPDIDVVEVHEGFAANVLYWADALDGDLERVNLRGGGIALGHPLGASGARVLTTLVHLLEDRGARYGLQVMPQGGGLANAIVIERLP